MPEFPDLDPVAIQDALDLPDAAELGEAYRRQGFVVVLKWDEPKHRLTGVIKGSRGRSYLTTATIDLVSGEIGGTTCTCSFGRGCKHVAAMLLEAQRKAEAPQDDRSRSRWGLPAGARGAPPPSRPVAPPWEKLLRPLATARLADEMPAGAAGRMGLQFRVNGLTQTQALAGVPLPAGAVSLSMHPVIWSNDRWVGGYAAGWPGRYDDGRRYGDPWVREWLAALAGACPTLYGYGGSEWVQLDRVAGRLLWTLLAEGAARGVPYVGASDRQTFRLASSVDLELDIRRAGDGGLSATRRLLVDGAPFAAGVVGVIGGAGAFGIRAEGKDRTTVFGPSSRPLGEAGLALTSLPSVTIAPADEARFWTGVFPALRSRVPVVSGDASVDLPTPPRPTLVVEVRFPDVTTVNVACSWDYDGQPRPWTYQADDVRDRLAEAELAARVDAVLRDALGTAVAPYLRFEGARAVALARALPDLEVLDDVVVRRRDEVPDYREPAEAPLVRVAVAEGDDPDWFDLGVRVSVEGREVPFTPLFAALARGDEWLILEDGTLLRTDLPVFAQLRDLIAEAQRLTDRPGPLRLNRYAVSLWGEFEDLADQVEQSDRWRTQVAALAHLGKDGVGVDPVPVPTGLVAELRPYQVAGYQWLVFCWRHGLGGILADDMGLGKTVEVLALVAHAVEAAAPADGEAVAYRPPFLVVAPASVVANWGLEAARFTPGLRTAVLTTTLAKSEATTLSQVAAESDLVVTSYAIFRLDYAEFAGVAWAGLILDEAQFLKNAKTKANECARALPAPFKLAVTGTPMENNLLELWALTAVVAPGLFPYASRFREDYVRPVAGAARARATLGLAEAGRLRVYPAEDRASDEAAVVLGDAALARLRRRLRPLLLRRTKEQVTPELPARIEQELGVELAPRHRRIYDTLLQRERGRVLGLLDDYQANRFEIFRSLMLLRRAALDAALIDPAEYAAVPSAKLDTLFDQLDDVVASGHRALVFSQFTTFLARIGARARAQGFDYEYLDGSTTNRPRVIKRFREGDAPLFLISLKAGGFGLNLTEADYVFLMDPWWNPATENQAIDRTHRIGQTRTVMVFRLVATGTIEDKVMALKARKARLFNAVLDDDSGAFARSLAPEDIRALFETD